VAQFASEPQPSLRDSDSQPALKTSSSPGPHLVLFNSLTKRMEPFTSLNPNRVRMYTCGLTVNDLMHLGHARAYVVWDVLKRYLEYLGYEVFHVSNVTDIGVDDKILRRLNESGESFQEYVSRYTQSYFEDRLKLGIAPANMHPLATQHIQEMIELTEKLVKKGFAYETDDGVYFRISEFEPYGKLSGIVKDKLEAGLSRRVSKDEYEKEEIGDFVLWKKSKPGEPYWHSPWGHGRPGWHIECSAMAMKYLGESFDMHCGGEEHRFPHHENEIAQSEAVTGKPLAKYWLHVRHLLLNGRKMSKSTREFVSVRDAVQKYGALPVRIFLLSTHYRKTMNMDEGAFHTALVHADKISELWAIVGHYAVKGRSSEIPSEDALLAQLRRSRLTFEGAMTHDLNAPLALSALLELARRISNYLNSGEDISQPTASVTQDFLNSAGCVLFGDLVKSELRREDDKAFGGLVQLILEQRDAFRAEGEYQKADRIRSELQQLGVVLYDLPHLTIWRRMHQNKRQVRR